MRGTLEFIIALVILGALIALPATVWLAVFRTSPDMVRIVIYNVFILGYGMILLKGVHREDE